MGNGEKDSKLVEVEINKLKSVVSDGETQQSNAKSFEWSDLKSKTVQKSLTIGVVLVVLNQFSGVATMLCSYAATIFQASGSNMSPNMSAIVVAAIQLFSTIIVPNLIDRAGRKVGSLVSLKVFFFLLKSVSSQILFAVSNIGTALGLCVLGIYVMLKDEGYQVEAFNWVPLISFSFVIFVAALGILTIPIIVLSEIMPEKTKDFSVSMCMTLLWILSFITTKYLPLLTDVIGFGGSMFLFAGVCVACEIFIIFFCPETKGKSHEEIMEALR